MANFLRVLVLSIAAFAASPAWSQTTSVIVILDGMPRETLGGDDLTFDFIVDPNGPTPPSTETITFPIKSSRSSYLNVIRTRVKEIISASEGINLQNTDIIIWPLFE